jgi:hypothetical protein
MIHTVFRLARPFSEKMEIRVLAILTGARDNGNGVASLQLQYQFWYNSYGNWAMRGT